MRIAVIIPAHNEEKLIGKTLDSLLGQSHQPHKIIVVNDNSTDGTQRVLETYKSDLIKVITNTSSDQNIPGSKVIKAFEKGLAMIDIDQYDIICKYDADLIFPPDYLEMIVAKFNTSSKIGMVAGHCTIEKNGNWIVENLNNPDHIRGALKAYSSHCFKKIGGLKTSIGWDTVDEMVARYYQYEVVTIPDLYVKHLKPTGYSYAFRSQELQGEAFYKMRYGIFLTLITALKMSFKKKKKSIIKEYLKGYYNAKKNNLDPLVSKDQGRFIRKYRWSGMYSKLGLK